MESNQARRPFGDHLRVCGADREWCECTVSSAGSSPRVRSRLPSGSVERQVRGIISACAEQTLSIVRAGISWRDHLRVCGADQAELGERCRHEGSSPRVRSRQRLKTAATIRWGIISACAEQTTGALPSIRRRRDHLRVCGADPSRRTR